jgi:hypothetical protein
MNSKAIIRIDKDWFESGNLRYRDDGYVSVGAKTRKYSIFSKHNGSLLGIIKWMARWRSYCFWPYNSVFDAKCLREIATFCEDATLIHRDRVGRKPPVFKKRIEAKAKYY